MKKIFKSKNKTDAYHTKVIHENWVGKDFFQSNGSRSFSRVLQENDLHPFLLTYVQEKLHLEDTNQDSSFTELLSLLNNSLQIDEALECIKGNKVSIDIDTQTILKIIKRKYELQQINLPTQLQVLCELELSYITIPDPQKDEIVFSLLLNTAISLASLEKYVSENKVIPKKEFKKYVRKWEKTGLNDGLDQKETKLLEKVLKIEFMEGFETELQYIAYNYQENLGDPRIWRVCAFNTHVRIPLDFKDYPFDHHFLSFYLLSPETFDVTDFQLFANESKSDSSLHTNQLIPPRSFKLKSRSNSLMEISNITRLDYSPESMIRFDLEFARTSSTFLWHTFIPSAVISVFSFLSTAFALFFNANYLKEVLTQVIPSTIIAIAALQLVAAQTVPQNSGHTRQDNIFVMYYVSLVILFISPHFHNSLISALLFCLNAGAVLLVLISTTIKIFKNR